MKRAAYVMLILIATVMLAACETQRFGQCDPTSAPGVNCYPKQGSAPSPKNPPF
jgi:hypothetical protein